MSCGVGDVGLGVGMGVGDWGWGKGGSRHICKMIFLYVFFIHNKDWKWPCHTYMSMRPSCVVALIPRAFTWQTLKHVYSHGSPQLHRTYGSFGGKSAAYWRQPSVASVLYFAIIKKLPFVRGRKLCGKACKMILYLISFLHPPLHSFVIGLQSTIADMIWTYACPIWTKWSQKNTILIKTFSIWIWSYQYFIIFDCITLLRYHI